MRVLPHFEHPEPIDERSEVCREAREMRQHPLVKRPRIAREELDDADGLARQANRKGDPAADAVAGSDVPAEGMALTREVRKPDGGARAKHATRQSLARRKCF